MFMKIPRANIKQPKKEPAKPLKPLVNHEGGVLNLVWCPWCETHLAEAFLRVPWTVGTKLICYYGVCQKCFEKMQRSPAAERPMIITLVELTLVQRHPHLEALLPPEYLMPANNPKPVE